MTGRVLSFPKRFTCSSEAQAEAKQLLEIPFAARLGKAVQLRLDDPERMLSICGCLRDQMDSSPACVRDEAEFFYRFIEKPRRAFGLFDERQYFLGELALIAGTACRHLSRRDEARLWFDRSEAGFRETVSPEPDLCRLAYQRLALRLEERQLEAVLELAAPLAESFKKFGMGEDSLKCHFLEGSALMESARPEEAVGTYQGICESAATLGSKKLLALGYTNLTHAYVAMCDPQRAVEASQKAVVLLNQVGDRIGLAKVQWAIATLLRDQSDLASAIEAYRATRKAFESLGMRADVAALSLVVADLLLETGHEQQAMREILAAMPVIDELKMVPEGVAALSLLRESLRHQRINREALRDLHGFFEDLKS